MLTSRGITALLHRDAIMSRGKTGNARTRRP
jgi:hypothetical protein